MAGGACLPAAAHAAESAAGAAASPLLRLPLKLAAAAVRGRLSPWERGQLALACRHGHEIACASVGALVLRDAKFAGLGSGSFHHSLSGGSSRTTSSSGDGRRSTAGGNIGGGPAADGDADGPPPPPFSGCAALSLRPRTTALLSKMIAGLLLPGHLRSRLPALEEISIEIHDIFLAACDLSLHVTSVALQARGVRKLRIDQPGRFTAREAAAVARMGALESLAVVCTQGLEPGALAALASGAAPSSNGGALPPPPPPAGAGLRGRLRHLHIELVGDEAPLGAAALSAVGSASPSPQPGGASSAAAAAAAALRAGGAPASPAAGGGTPGSRGGAAAPPPRLLAADEVALSGFAVGLESLALTGLAPQLRGCATKPWEPLLSEAADLASAAAAAGAAPGGAPAGGPRPPPLRRLALRCCGEVGPSALAAAADVPGLEQVDLTGSEVVPSDAERLGRVPGLAGLGVAPLPAAAPLLAALAAGCPGLRRVSAGGLLAGCEGPPAAALPSVEELQLLCTPAHGPRALGRAGLHLVAGLLPRLSALEIVGAWDVDAAAVAALCDLLGRCPRLRRLRLEGAAARPLHAPLLLPLMAAAPAAAALELLCVEGLDDEWMIEAVARAQKAGAHCMFREVRELTLGAPPPPPPGAAPRPPPPPVLAAPPAPRGKGAAGAGAALIAAALRPAGPGLEGSTFLGMPSGQLSDKGLVRLFGAMRLRRLGLRHLPGVSLAGVKALTRGVPGLERVEALGCLLLSAAPRDAVAAAGALGGRVVAIDVQE
ncbi:MAG: hypothetical protein J3K34DRAFT_393674 [Monoraphidium minutum]|nr:MAG: hypothetical protein J3K34DRAFT_393674 [Monoraphidium minutum]